MSFAIGISLMAGFLAGYVFGVGRPREHPVPVGILQGPQQPPHDAWSHSQRTVPKMLMETQTRSAHTREQTRPAPPDTAQMAPTPPGKELTDRPRVVPHPIDLTGQPGVIEGVPARSSVFPPVPAESLEEMADAVDELRGRDLLLPLEQLKREDLRDSFHESRGNHLHEAIDILAPRNTPVLAVEDGTIARLWFSLPGGITIYQFDPKAKYEYYYAHLERYAEHLKEGDHVKRGQIIGYVGTSGNAPENTPHLHFTIFKLTEEKHWWQGTPINPYLVFR